jgi:hypothetical protein
MPLIALLDTLWRQQSMWSRTANRLKRRIDRARTVALVDTIAIAVLGTVAGLLTGHDLTASRLLAAAAAFGAALLPILGPAWSGTALQNWTRARSVSEALKGEIYLWLARAGHYRDDPTGERLRERVDRIRSEAVDLLVHRLGIVAEQRDLPLVCDAHSYFAVRVGGQIDNYYRPRAAQVHGRLRRFRIVEIALSAASAAIAAVAVSAPGTSLTPWIAVITTITAALAVHVAATRYEYQRMEYLRTADRLEQLKARAGSSTSPEELDDLVLAAESVISVENQAWMVRLAEEPGEQRPANPQL